MSSLISGRSPPTFKQWVGFELSARNRFMLYVPAKFCARLPDARRETEVFNQMSEVYAPDSARGVRWNDPAFDILWPGWWLPLTSGTYPDFQL
jgi:dTDP-4-dehydrorhamnose 3,5-epimerase